MYAGCRLKVFVMLFVCCMLSVVIFWVFIFLSLCWCVRRFSV